MEEKIRIIIAEKKDAAQLLAVYAPYVEKTAVSFEYEVPKVQEFERRIASVLEKYPYLAAQREEEIVGYAYAGAFHARKAYQWAAETSIYVREDQRRTGVGKALYQALEKILTMQNILNLNACIAFPEEEDEFLTKNSVRFHECQGYRIVGKFHNCGYKFGRWYHMVWMEKIIGEHMDIPNEVKWFPDIRDLIDF